MTPQGSNEARRGTAVPRLRDRVTDDSTRVAGSHVKEKDEAR
jgi:hypothetical protein